MRVFLFGAILCCCSTCCHTCCNIYIKCPRACGKWIISGGDFDRRVVLPGRLLFVLLFTGIDKLLFIVRDLFRHRGFNTDDYAEVPKTFVDADSSGVVHRVGVVWFLSLVSQRFLRLESCTNANLARFLVRVTHGFLLPLPFLVTR